MSQSGLIPDFIFSPSRQSMARVSREAFPYLVELLNTCRKLLESNVHEYLMFQEDPMYKMMEGVNSLITKTANERKFDLTSLLESVREIATKVPTTLMEDITAKFGFIGAKERKTAVVLQRIKGKLDCCIEKARDALKDTYHVDVIFYKCQDQGDPVLTTVAVPNCTAKSTVDFVLINVLVHRHISLRDNPHFYDSDVQLRSPQERTKPLLARSFSEQLEVIGRSIKNSMCEPLQLYCVTDQLKYPRILFKIRPQRVFTNVWVIGHEAYLKEINGRVVSSSDSVITKMFEDNAVCVTKHSKDSASGEYVNVSDWRSLLNSIYAAREVKWIIKTKNLSQASESTESFNSSNLTLVNSSNTDSVNSNLKTTTESVVAHEVNSMSNMTLQPIDTFPGGFGVQCSAGALLDRTATAEQWHQPLQGPPPNGAYPLGSVDAPMHGSPCKMQPAKRADESSSKEPTVAKTHPPIPTGYQAGKATHSTSQTVVPATGQVSSPKAAPQPPPKGQRKWYEPIIGIFRKFS